MTLHGLSKKLGKDRTTIEKRVRIHAKKNKDWYIRRRAKTGQVFWYIAEPLVDTITEELSGWEKAPSGWQTKYTVAREIGRGEPWVEDVSESYRVERPDWFADYQARSGGVFPHYHPDLCDVLRTESEKESKAPDGWVTATGLARSLPAAYTKTVRRIAEALRAEHPEWIERHTTQGVEYDYYHPQLVTLIIQELTSRESAPDGWLTMSAVSRLFDVHPKTLRRILDGMDIVGPKSIRPYTIPNGQVRDHYSPGMVVDIGKSVATYKQELEEERAASTLKQESKREREAAERRAQEEKDRDGWHTIGEMAALNGVASSTVGAFLKRMTLGDGATKSIKRRGKPATHYSNDVAKKVAIAADAHKTEVSKYDEPPAGWESIGQIARRLGERIIPLQKIATALEESMEDMHGRYLGARNKPATFYHPVFVAELEKKARESRKNKAEKAPSGWESKTTLARRLKVDPASIDRIVARLSSAFPDEMKEYVGYRRPSPHFGARLVAAIELEVARGQKEIEQLDAPPAGYVSRGEIVSRVNGNSATVSSIAERLSSQYPDQSGVYLTSRRRPGYFFSADLAAAIEEEYKRIKKRR